MTIDTAMTNDAADGRYDGAGALMTDKCAATPRS